jgi:transcriptional regulator of acetoin/glycerol metabolism
VRQLRNVLRTLAALCEEGRIGLDDLPAMIRQARPAVRPVLKSLPNIRWRTPNAWRC